MTSDDGEYYDAEHEPNPVLWRPVKRRKVIHTDRGPIVAWPDDVELLDKRNGTNWLNKARDFARRYKLEGKALEEFKRRFPDVEID